MLVLHIFSDVEATDWVEAVEPLYLVSMQQYCPVPHAALFAELPAFVPAGQVLDVWQTDFESESLFPEVSRA